MLPITFLANASEVVSGPELASRARRAEDSGYHGLVVPDHLLAMLSPVAAMATIAAATTRLRVGAFVMNNDLRHPAVLAHDLASIDILSQGRLDVAMGAGWNRPEYEAIGLRFDQAPVRQARLAEAVAVLKGAFSGESFSFSGDHYTINSLQTGLIPAQRPHPPFFIGGGGRRTLELAGRTADIVGLAPRLIPGRGVDPRSMTLAATREKVEWVRKAAGDRFSTLTFNVYSSSWPSVVTDDLYGEARRVVDHLRSISGLELSEQDVVDSPHVFVGSVDRIVEKVLQLREELGITSVLLGAVGELDAVVERLC